MKPVCKTEDKTCRQMKLVLERLIDKNFFFNAGTPQVWGMWGQMILVYSESGKSIQFMGVGFSFWMFLLIISYKVWFK